MLFSRLVIYSNTRHFTQKRYFKLVSVVVKYFLNVRSVHFEECHFDTPQNLTLTFSRLSCDGVVSPEYIYLLYSGWRRPECVEVEHSGHLHPEYNRYIYTGETTPSWLSREIVSIRFWRVSKLTEQSWHLKNASQQLIQV